MRKRRHGVSRVDEDRYDRARARRGLERCVEGDGPAAAASLQADIACPDRPAAQTDGVADPQERIPSLFDDLHGHPVFPLGDDPNAASDASKIMEGWEAVKRTEAGADWTLFLPRAMMKTSRREVP
jgi:hypothetical protein